MAFVPIDVKNTMYRLLLSGTFLFHRASHLGVTPRCLQVVMVENALQTFSVLLSLFSEPIRYLDQLVYERIDYSWYQLLCWPDCI